MQPIQCSMLLRMDAGTSRCETRSLIASRPPGFSTRNASENTVSLSPERLTTQLEMMTSTVSSGRGTFSISPLRNSTLETPAVSRHLAYLRRSGLVDARRDGVWMHYRLSPPAERLAGSIVDAALHAVGHATIAGSDRKKLARVAGLDVKAAACCTPGCRS